MAGEQVIAKTVIQIGIDRKTLEKGVQDAKKAVKMGMSGLWEVIKQPTFALASFSTIKGAFSSFMEEAQNIDRFSRIVGTNYEEMSRWSTMASEFGVTSEQLADVLADLNDKMSDFNNTGGGAFKEVADLFPIDTPKGPLGFKDAKTGELLPTLKVLNNISEAVKGMNRQEGVGLLKRLGINDPKILAMMLNDTGKSLSELAEKVNGNALYMKEDAKAAQELQKSIRELSRIFKMTFIPVFSTVARVIAPMAKHVGILSAAVGAFALVLGHVIKLKVAQAFASWGVAAMPLLKLFGIIALAVYVLDDLIVWAKDGKSAYEDFWNLFGDGFKNAVRGIVEFVAKNKEVIILVLALGSTIWSAVKALKGLFDAVKAGTTVVKLFGLALNASIGPYVLALLAIVAVLAIVIYYWDDIRKAGQEALSSLMAWCTEVGDKIQEVTNNIKQWWDETWQSMCDGVAAGVEFWKQTIDGFLKWLGFGPLFGKGEEEAIAMAPGAETNISRTLNNEQTNNVTIYGDVSKETVGNAVAGASENGWSSMVDSGNYG